MPRLVFIGTKGEIEEWERNHRYHSSLLLEVGKKRILFDYGRISPPLESINPTHIFISHGHIDSIGGLYRLVEEGKSLPIIPIYVTRENVEKLKKLGFKNVIKMRRGKTVKIDSVEITPLSVIHSIKYPCVGFLIKVDDKKIWYCTDFIWLRGYTRKLKDLDIWIGDGSRLTRDQIFKNEKGEIWGHSSIRRQIKMAERVGCKIFIVSHLGKECVEMRENVLRKRVSEMSDKLKTIIARDRMVLDLDKLSEEELQITTEDIKELIPKKIATEETPKTGIYLVEPHARWIYEGVKKAIVKSRKFTEHVNKPLYLLGNGFVYGIISLKEPEEISLEDFKRLKNLHLVSEEERERWWKGKKTLYFYKVDVLKRFPEPIRVEIPRGVQTFVSVEKIKVLDEEVELIADWRKYNPEKVQDDVLRDDHRICLTPDTPILTEREIKSVEECKSSERLLLTEEGEKMMRFYRGEIVKIVISRLGIFRMTPDHPILTVPVRKRSSKHYFGVRSRDEKGRFRKTYPKSWRKAENCEGYAVCVPKLPEIETEYSEEMFELCGWYVAEGFITKNQVRFSLNKKEIKEAERIKELIQKNFGVKATIKEYERELRVSATSREMVDFFKSNFRTGSLEKTLPTWLLLAEKKKILEFLKAYFKGDGWSSNGYTRAQTSSRKLAIGIFLLLLKLKIIPSIHERMNKGSWKCNYHRAWTISFRGNFDNPKAKKDFDEDGEFYYFRIRKVEKENYEGLVYNFTKCEFYHIPFRVHNCHSWYSWLKKNPSRKLESEQFKDLSREEQIKVIKELHEKIVKEFERRGWKHNTPLGEEMKFTPPKSLEMIDSEYIKKLTDEELLELHKWLHEKFHEWKGS